MKARFIEDNVGQEATREAVKAAGINTGSWRVWVSRDKDVGDDVAQAVIRQIPSVVNRMRIQYERAQQGMIALLEGSSH